MSLGPGHCPGPSDIYELRKGTRTSMGFAHFWLSGFDQIRVSFWSYLEVGLQNGALYAMIAVGYTLVYGVLGLINFAHGEVFMMRRLRGRLSHQGDPRRARGHRMGVGRSHSRRHGDRRGGERPGRDRRPADRL